MIYCEGERNWFPESEFGEDEYRRIIHERLPKHFTNGVPVEGYPIPEESPAAPMSSNLNSAEEDQ